MVGKLFLSSRPFPGTGPRSPSTQQRGSARQTKHLAMENQSMRRRQTVLGEQLQGSIESFANASLNVPRSRANNRRPSNASLVAPAPVQNARAAASSNSLTAPSMAHGNSSAALSIGSNPNSGSALSLNHRAASHRRSFSRMSARMSAIDDSGLLNDQASVRSAVFDDEEFDPQLMHKSVDPAIFLAKNLAGAGVEDLLRFGETLKQQAQLAMELEQHSVQHNQKSLTTIASSVAKLAPAVAELRRKVGDLSLVTDAIRQDAIAAQTDASLAQSRRLSLPPNHRASTGASIGQTLGPTEGAEAEEPSEPDEGSSADVLRTNKRQSIYVLNTSWAQGLNDLYQRIRGSQRALPPAPGRHLVLEEPGWMELNPVTLQSVRPVLLCLLSDHFMLAAQHQGQITHEWHAALDEPLQVSMNEPQKLLKVAHLALLAPNISRLRAVYAEICKLQELANAASTKNRGFLARSASKLSAKRSQRRNRALALSSHSRNHSRNLSDVPQLDDNDTFSRHQRQTSHHSISSIPEINLEQKREGARILADIDAAIAERRFAEAVNACLEQQHDKIVSGLVHDRIDRLAELLLAQVRQFSTSTQDELSGHMKLLVQLGRAVEGKTTLLDAAAADIENQAHHVHFMGDVSSYISQMAAIYFQTINATITVYRRVFPKKEDSSVVVSWTKSQVDIYTAIFNRQLFRIDPALQTYQRCREVSRLESSQLREQKINMDFMLRYVWEE